MIQIKDKTETNTVYFPKNLSENYNIYYLELYSASSKDEYDFTLVDKSGLTNYYVFSCNFSSLQDGEYTYKLRNNANKRLAEGLLRIGEPKNTDTKYDLDLKYNIYEG